MVAFGIGHMLYISALGFRPLKLIPGVILYLMSTVMVYILMPGLNEVSLKIGVPLYSYILATMAWRAVARISRNDSGSIEWNGLITGLGGLAWVFSDASLGYHHFHSPLPYSQVLIMISYYLGQLGITMSVLNFGSSKLE
ncbi:hypothetical protein AAG570_013174 [Ranatra chinensis]|uniref:lysoplasmalogenase n=1 Tax=Ranatra chinensis TaxID=642074 RepID=A0ABD0YGB3_9HEMI